MTVRNSQASSFEHGHATAADFQINLSFPFPSFPSFPVLSLPFPSFSVLSLPFPFFPFLSVPFPSFPFCSLPFPSCPFRSLPFPFFPEARVPVAQPSATTRNRPRDCYMAVPLVSSPEGLIFAFRVAGVALRDIQTCFVTCRKSFCVAGALLLRRFQKMRCSFRGRRSTLDVSIVILPSRRSTLDASCCVFFTNRIGRAASSGDKVQIPWQTWHFVRCAENWRKPPTKHRLWGSKFKGSYENSQENVNFEAVYKVWKLEEVSHERLVLMLPHLSSQVSGFPVASPCLWGKLQNLSFSKVSKQVVMSFCVARVALYTLHSTTLYTLTTLHTPHSTLHHTLHFAHSSLHTLN